MNKKLKAFAQIGVLAVAIAFTSSCKKKSGTSSVHPPIMPANSCYLYGSTLTGDAANNCCQSGVPKSPIPEGCPQPPGIAPTLSTMKAFNNTLTTGRAALGEATSLSDGSGAAAVETAAATAVDAPKPTELDGGEALRSNLDPNFSATGGRPSGNGSGTAGGTMGSGGTLSMGSVDTKPAFSAPQGAAALAVGDVPGTGYSSGGAGAGGGGSRGGYENPFGGGGAIGGGGSAQFGRALASGSVMGSTDPDDYFSLLKPTDSIFKIVEKRYGAKQKSWALTDAYQASQSVQGSKK